MFLSLIVIFVFINVILSLNFNNIDIQIDIKCLNHYSKYVQPSHNNDNNNITFSEYLEYWWNLEESEEELTNRVCNYIYEKYPKKSLRVKF